VSERQTAAPIYTRGRDKFAKVAWVLNLLTAFYKLFPISIRIKLFEHNRRTQGLKGIGIRYALLKTIAPKCGDNVSIHPDVFLLNPQNFSVGNNVSIHPMCYIECGNPKDAGVEVGSDVSIAHGVTIMASEHTFSDSGVSIKDQTVQYRRVVICSNVWIGAKATILAGRKVGTGAIIGAGAVVTHDVESNTTVAGIPAREIKRR